MAPSNSKQELHVAEATAWPADQYTLLREILSVVEYLWVSAVVVGIPGNALAFIVATRKGNRKLSACCYIGALSVTDNLVLVSFPIMYVIQYLGLAATSDVAREGLRVCFYLVYTASTLSSLFLALMSVERMIAVKLPLVAMTYCTRRRAWVVIGATTFLVSVTCLHVFYVYRYQAVGEDLLLGPNVPEAPILATLSTAYFMAVGTVAPSIVIIISNIIIIVTVQSARRSRDVMAAKSNVKDTHLTRMLVVVSVAYLTTAIPYRVYDLISTAPFFTSLYDLRDPYWNLRFNIESLFMSFLSSFNFAINFYLYIVAGGTKYRNDVREVLRSLNCWK